MQSASLGPLPLEPASTGQSSAIVHTDPRLAEMALLLPPHLELRRIIGEGGSSVVFEAFHTRLKVLVAVKVLSVRGELAEQAYTRMTREAELYALLDDPRIPRVYDVNELSNGTPYVVMEMVPGDSLEELLRKHTTISLPLALTITSEVLSALVCVHERGVLHRDVKPANVILNFPAEGGCQLRLVDFGIAKAATYGTGQEAVTQRGTLVGTPQYMPPERLTGQEASAMSDTYAVGVMLYEMLSGRVPFGGPNLGAVMASVLRDVPQPLFGRCPEVSREVEQLVMRAISRDLQQRFTSAQEMLDAVRALSEPAEERSGARLVEPALRQPELQVYESGMERDFHDDLHAVQRGKRSYAAVLLSIVALMLVGLVGWFYAEYQANTGQRAHRENMENVAAPEDSAALPVAPAAVVTPDPQEPARVEAAPPPAQLAPLPETAITSEAQPTTSRSAKRHRARRDRHEREESIAPAEIAPSAPPVEQPRAAPDYAKLLPENPF
jgi:hypothetical protein